MIILGILYSFEMFLERWFQIISLITAMITIFVPVLIYIHQRKETDEKTRQGIISVIEEAWKECNEAKKISVLCEEVRILGEKLKTLYSEDDINKSIQIAKRRLSEFKRISKKLHMTDKMREFDIILIENRNRKIWIINRRKKVRVKELEDKLLLIYALLEVNYQLRATILQKIPEVDVILNSDVEELDNNEIFALRNIHNTFDEIAELLSQLKNNSSHIIEMRKELAILVGIKDQGVAVS